MRKEILGIFLVFLVVFTLMSLLSFHPADPSVHHAVSTNNIHNIFGRIGAHSAGFLLGLLGVGAFWIPLLLLSWSLHLFREHDGKAIAKTLAGGVLLMIATGALAALTGPEIELLGRRFPAGGLIGNPMGRFLTTYANTAGALFFLVLLWLIGLMLALRVSVVGFLRQSATTLHRLGDGLRNWAIKWRERQKKAQQRTKSQKRKPRTPSRKIKIDPPVPSLPKPVAKPRQQEFDFMPDSQGFQPPPVSLLDDPAPSPPSVGAENLRMLSKQLEKKLADFGVMGSVVTVLPGPVITTFEYEPAPGVKINKIVGLSDDLSLALRAMSIRIVAPIPGKAVIGIEIPNPDREIVRFKEVIVSAAFEKSPSKLTICLGKNMVGAPVITVLDRMPHLLIAGATGTGKSVGLNAMICSLLYKSSPEEVKLIMIDPKRIELSMYDGIPHLITPVVTDVKKATNALFWAVKEMERRYEVLSEQQARNITQYNRKYREAFAKDPQTPLKPMPFVVIVIDELADLMMVASRDVELALMRLAQMARAAGIHLILATQRPSVDVLTGIIKANFPTRISFQVSSRTDSRTIIDANGAENLLGSGDMLLLPPGTAKLQRVHGAYISEGEIVRVTDFLKNQQKPEYDTAVVTTQSPAGTSEKGDQEYDEKYDEAMALVTETRQASISKIQRHLRIGYNRAARIIETMEREGVVGPSDGAKPREVLVRDYKNLP